MKSDSDTPSEANYRTIILGMDGKVSSCSPCENSSDSGDEIVVFPNHAIFGYHTQLTRRECEHIKSNKLTLEETNLYIHNELKAKGEKGPYLDVDIDTYIAAQNITPKYAHIDPPVVEYVVPLEVKKQMPVKRKPKERKPTKKPYDAEADTRIFTRGKSVCFTSYSESINPSINERVSYFAYQREVCPETGRLHYQGYVQFSTRQTAFYVKSWLGDNSAHCELQRSPSNEVARDYCTPDIALACRGGKTKTETGEYIKGTFRQEGIFSPTLQGKRSDLESVMECVRNGETMFSIMNKHPKTFATYSKFIRQYKSEYQLTQLKEPVITLRDWQKRVWETIQEEPVHRRITWIWSETSGTGKSTFMVWVHSKLTNAMLSVETFNYADILFAYDSHRVIYFDISRCQDNISIANVNSVLEKLSNISLKLSTKYESVQKYVNAHIVVTSNKPPPIREIPLRFVEYDIEAKLGPDSYTIKDHTRVANIR